MTVVCVINRHSETKKKRIFSFGCTIPLRKTWVIRLVSAFIRGGYVRHAIHSKIDRHYGLSKYVHKSLRQEFHDKVS